MGRLDEVIDSISGTWSYGYDIEDRQTSVTDPDRTVNYEYDNMGRVERTYTAKTDTRYAYDELGRLETVAVHERANALLVTPETSTYHYDAVGNLNAIEQSNGIVSDYDYDDLNRLVSLVHFTGDANGNEEFDSGETLVSKFEYSLNSDGTRWRATETNDLAEQTTTTWFYDGLNRLTIEKHDAAGGTAGDYTTTYGFDLSGNRVKKTTDLDNDDDIDETITYTNDANDRLTSEVKNTPLSANRTNTVYAYDPDGNGSDNGTEQTSKTVRSGTNVGSGTLKEKTTYAHEVLGRMSQVQIDSNGDGVVNQTLSYKYDDTGIRVEQSVTENSVTMTTEYLIDANNHTGYAQVLEEYINGTLNKTYTLGHDVLTQTAPATGVTLPTGVSAGDSLTLLYDGHGSTRALADAAGDVLQRAAYDAYGVHLTGTSLTAMTSLLTTLLYSGEQTDRSTGLQYLRARYYDPRTGTFETLDPATGNNADPLSLHKYLYTHANPINGSDPSGTLVLMDKAAAAYEGAKLRANATLTIGRSYLTANQAIAKLVIRLAIWPLIVLGAKYGQWTRQRNASATAVPPPAPAPNPALAPNHITQDIILKQDEDRTPFILYRTMIESNGMPMLGITSRYLGVRTPADVKGKGTGKADITPDSNGTVHPLSGGMSVTRGDPQEMYFRVRPEAIPGGLSKDPLWALYQTLLSPNPIVYT